MINNLTDFIRFHLIVYFSNYHCPNSFSLTSEDSKKNDFYEVHIYVPELLPEEVKNIPKANRGALRIFFEFMPFKNAKEWGHILYGCKKEGHEIEFKPVHLSACYLRYSRIDVNYFFSGWDVREQDCSLSKLIWLFSLRYFRLIHLSILSFKIERYFHTRKILKKLRVPLRSKYDIYEALLESDEFLRTGRFKKSDLTKLIFGNHYLGKYEVYQKVRQSLDWILEACLDDNEIEKVGYPQGETDPTYKMKGKGIDYFTLTKEKLKLEEWNKEIQQQQAKTQRGMAWLTVLLVIGTFLTAIDKFDVKAIYEQVTPYITSVMEELLSKIT